MSRRSEEYEAVRAFEAANWQRRHFAASERGDYAASLVARKMVKAHAAAIDERADDLDDTSLETIRWQERKAIAVKSGDVDTINLCNRILAILNRLDPRPPIHHGFD